jgi:hypothetical protein
MKPINDYLRSANSEPPITKGGRPKVIRIEEENVIEDSPPKRKRGRPRKINFLSPINLVLSLFFMLNYFMVSGEQIEWKFKFCEHKKSFLEIVDDENSCFWSKQASKYFPENTKFNMYTLSKQKHRIYGKGFQCKETITIKFVYCRFLGRKI